MLSGHEANILDLELARDFAELRKALPPLLRIVGRVRKIAGKYDEIGLIGEAVYGGDRFFQRPFGIGIGRSLKSPVRIGELHKIEVIGCLSVCGVRNARTQRRCKDDSAQTSQFQKFPPIDRLAHSASLKK